MTTEEQPPRQEHFEEGAEAPPPGVHAMAIVRWLLLIAMAVAALWSIASYAHEHAGHAAASKPKYHCPMHPQITSDQPGECPICHMNLEPFDEKAQTPGAVAVSAAATPSAAPRAPNDAGSSAAESSAAAQKPYFCEMHPEVQSDDPNARCPKCGMKLTKRSDAPAKAPPGTTPITLSFDRIQAIGVRTALVERRTTSEALRVNAVVRVPDEARAEVHFRAAGFVEAIRVKELGVKVKAGELLASIYSPEIYQAEQELIAARAWSTGFDHQASPASPGLDGGGGPFNAAKKRLDLLGVGTRAVDEVARSGKPFRDVGVSSPIAGFVVAKSVVLGSRVEPAMTLFEIADLSRVYVIANVYPQELAGVRIGDAATFTTPALPDRSFEAKVDLIYPDVDLDTRTARVRFHVGNGDLLLRPGQFGTAQILGKESRPLTVPLDAVIDTGLSTYVFLVEEAGRFTPRVVELGDQLADRYAIRAGLDEGDRIVSGATFLIDSESRLQASLSEKPAAAGSAEPAAPESSCDREFDRDKYPDKYQECRKCDVHRGMGTMEEDCHNAIPKPWR